MNCSSLPAHSPVRAILPLCLGLLLMAVGSSPASPTFRYREQTGGEAFTFSWQADREQGGATVTVTQRQGDEIFSSVNTAEGTTLSWRYVKQPDTDVRAERVGDRIRFSGAFGGKVIDKSESVDSRPWWQPLSFCLLRMIALETVAQVVGQVRVEQGVGHQPQDVVTEMVDIGSGGHGRGRSDIGQDPRVVFTEQGGRLRPGHGIFIQLRLSLLNF